MVNVSDRTTTKDQEPAAWGGDVAPAMVRDQLIKSFEAATLADPAPSTVPIPPGLFHAQAIHIVREEIARAGSQFENPSWEAVEKASAMAKEDALDLGIGPSKVNEAWLSLDLMLRRHRDAESVSSK